MLRSLRGRAEGHWMMELDLCKGPSCLGVNEEEDFGLKLGSWPYLWILESDFEKCVRSKVQNL